MAQDYVLKDFKISDYKDNNGNTWCTAVFDGEGEPVKWVVKDPTGLREGRFYYGHIEDKTSQAGKPYRRFYRDKRPDASSGASKSTYQPRDDMAIRAQWAIGQAVNMIGQKVQGETVTAITPIENLAKELYAMVERVKNSNGSEVREAESPTPSPSEGLRNTADQLSGIDKARAVANAQRRDDRNAEIRSLMEQDPQG